MASTPQPPVFDDETLHRWFLKDLSARQRLALRLKLVEKLSQVEIGARMGGITQPQVSSHLSTAIRNLEKNTTHKPIPPERIREALLTLPMTAGESEVLESAAKSAAAEDIPKSTSTPTVEDEDQAVDDTPPQAAATGSNKAADQIIDQPTAAPSNETRQDQNSPTGAPPDSERGGQMAETPPINERPEQPPEPNDPTGGLGSIRREAASQTPPPRLPSRVNWPMIGLGVGLLLLGLILGSLFNRPATPAVVVQSPTPGLTQTPMVVEKVVEVTSPPADTPEPVVIEKVATPTSGPTQTPIVVTPTPIPTDSGVTDTPRPAETPTSESLLQPFTDTFDDAIRPEWNYVKDEWITIGGQLTSLRDDALITLGDDSWGNYEINFVLMTNVGFCNVSVARHSGKGLTLVLYDTNNVRKHVEWFRDGTALPNTKIDFFYSLPARVQVTLRNGTVHSSVNGKAMPSITIPGYENGNVSIRCNKGGSVDDFSISPVLD